MKLGTVVLDDRGVHPDLLLSGINKGMNAGPDTNYSGTIGAAKEENQSQHTTRSMMRGKKTTGENGTYGISIMEQEKKRKLGTVRKHF